MHDIAEISESVLRKNLLILMIQGNLPHEKPEEYHNQAVLYWLIPSPEGRA